MANISRVLGSLMQQCLLLYVSDSDPSLLQLLAQKFARLGHFEFRGLLVEVFVLCAFLHFLTP
jgi:hypothetical protein